MPNDPTARKESNDDEEAEYSQPGGPKEDYFPLHILVVDDSASNLKLLTRMLSNRGHLCEGASNGEEAVQLVTMNPNAYDSILMDFEMPVMNGPDACARIRKLGCSSFIVGITGNVLPEDVAKFKNAGANSVLPKPFKMAALEQLWSEYGVSGRNSNLTNLDAPLEQPEEKR